MSSRRFELLLRFLHLNDSERQPKRGEPGYDRLYKIRPFLERIVRAFKSNYTPTQYLSVDESMIAYKGRLSFLQYLPKKPHKWGLKAWVLADAANGYTWGWKLYTGKEDGERTIGLAHQVVLQLVEDHRLLHKGYVVVTDSYYSSPALFKELITRGFGACGTVRCDRRGLPPAAKERLQRGETISSKDDSVLFLKWKDKREVLMLSTFHSTEMVMKSRRPRAVAGGGG